jgi:DNA-binding MarR family transcriptional regulator
MSKSHTGTLTLQQFLPYRLSALANRISQSLAVEYSERFNINVHEWRILAVLGEEGALSAVAITTRIAMGKVAVSRAVNSLIKKGLVIKDYGSKDQRSYELSLSNSGFTLYQQLVPIALAHEKRMMANLSLNERNDLLALLSKLDNTSVEV